MKNNPSPVNSTTEGPTHDELRIKVLHLVRRIPKGRVANYGSVGAACEPPISGYICGRLMQNTPPDVPWWRVVAKDGSLPAGKRLPVLAKEQRELLEEEGVVFGADGKVPQEYFERIPPCKGGQGGF